MKVVFCIPTITKPYQACLDSVRDSLPAIEAAGWEHAFITEIGCPYISAARATLLRKALSAKAEVIVFIDHDLSWRPTDLLDLIETEGEVVTGLYRFKKDTEEYMGTLDDIDGAAQVRADGAIKATRVPGGFLKITKEAVNKFMTAYPELCYGQKYDLSVDLFNHGAHNGLWWGEDYAFSRRWIEAGGELWIRPDLSINHHTQDSVYEGNYHQFLLRQPGGSEEQ